LCHSTRSIPRWRLYLFHLYLLVPQIASTRPWKTVCEEYPEIYWCCGTGEKKRNQEVIVFEVSVGCLISTPPPPSSWVDSPVPFPVSDFLRLLIPSGDMTGESPSTSVTVYAKHFWDRMDREIAVSVCDCIPEPGVYEV